MNLIVALSLCWFSGGVAVIAAPGGWAIWQYFLLAFVTADLTLIVLALTGCLEDDPPERRN